jgi:Protein of unknown function (DUF1631)
LGIFCSNNESCMDTPFPILSTEAFDALGLSEQTAPSAAAQAEPTAAPKPSAAPSLPLAQALAWSLELAPQVMTNLVSRAVQSMDRRLVSLMGSPHAQMLEEAVHAMEEQRAPWAKQYAALLRMAIAYPSPAKMAAIMPKVDLRICASETAQLDALVQAQGSRRANPLGPQAHVQAIVELLSRTPSEPAHRPIWAEHLLAALSSQLAWMYLQLHAVLRDPSSREASVLSQAAGFEGYAATVYGFAEDAADASQVDPETGVNPQTQALAEQARRTVQRLRQALGLPAEPDDGLAQALNANVMDVLLNDLDQAEQLMAQIRERGLPMPALDAGMDAEPAATPPPPAAAPVATTPTVQAEQIEQLIKTYQNTTSPSLQRVPVPLREALLDLQEPLLLLAQSDAQFLADSEHPAQRFLGLITQRSLRFSSEVADGFASFMSPIDKLIEAIAVMRQPSARVFEQACTSLSTLWQRQDDAQAQALAQAEREKEQLQAAKQMAGRLAFELVGRRDAGDAPPMIKQFLMGPWAQVLAKAQLFPDQPGDAARYTQVLAALLWSVSVRRAAARKSEHAALLPQLMAGLKAGLQSVRLADVQIDGYLSDIKKLHEAVQAAVLATDADTSLSDPAPLLAM